MTEHDQKRELTPEEMKASPKTAARDQQEPNPMTTWDGAGNPISHVFADDEEGRLAEGVGDTPEDAAHDARDTGTSRGVSRKPGLGG
jgi:hypothetical protein